MKSKILLLSLLTLLVTSSDFDTFEHVLRLTTDNFSEQLAKHEQIMVMFYKPACPHSRNFGPEYNDAAEELKTSNNPIPLAIINIDEKKSFQDYHKIKGVPTVHFYNKGEIFKFEQPRIAKELISFIKKHSQPLYPLLNTIVEIETFRKDNALSVIYYGQADSQSSIFEDTAADFNLVHFARCASQKCGLGSYVKEGTVVLSKPYDDKINELDSPFTKEQLTRFINIYSLPLVIRFNSISANYIAKRGVPSLILFSDKKVKIAEDLEKMLSTLAKKIRSYLQAVLVSSNNDYDNRLMINYNITAKQLPKIVIGGVEPLDDKFIFDGEINEANVLNFIDDWKNNRLEPFRRSEEVPKKQTEPEYILVGLNYEEVVMDESKDVLVFLYNPKCKHCEPLLPIYRELAKRLNHNDTLRIAKMDTTVNETVIVKVKSVPVFYLYRANDKEPLKFEGDRDLETLIGWLKKNTHFPISEKRQDEL